MPDSSDQKSRQVIPVVSAAVIGFLATLGGIWLYQNKDKLNVSAKMVREPKKQEAAKKLPPPWPRAQFDKVIEQLQDPGLYYNSSDERTRNQRKFGTTPVTTDHGPSR